MYYFDNAATTFPKPETVYIEMDNFYRSFGVNVGRGQFKEASIAHKMVDDTKELILDLFHCNSANKQVIFTSSATEATNLVLRGLPLKEGDVIYTTPFEHNAVLRTLHFLEADKKITVKTIDFKQGSFELDIESLYAQFDVCPPTVCIVNHASNVFGCVLPISDIFSTAKKFNATTIADCSQTAGVIDVNLIASFCDYAIFAGHKTLYGPLGVGGVVAPLSCKLLPLIYGGTGVESSNPNMPTLEPIRFEAGSPNIHAISGLNAALKWIKDESIDRIQAKEKESRNTLISILSKFDNIKIIGNSSHAEYVGIVSCVFDNYSSDSIGQVLSNFDIAVRTGLHCAPKAHEHMMTSPAGTIRFSIGYFTTDSDFVQLENALKYINENS